ncbi:MAG: LURP-one-related/scramblase family protein [Candidatus Nanohaloarchaea archaeon]
MTDLLSEIDFSAEEFTVKQSLVRNRYEIFAGDRLILKAKQNLFKMKEEFPFVDEEGREVFTIKAQQMLDIAGDYTLVDSGTGEEVAVLSKKFTLLKHVWKVKNTEGKELATIESRSAFIELLRSLSDVLSLLPHKYTITAEGRDIGSIEGRLSLRDTYDVKVERGVEGREAIIAAAVTIDALEGN